MKVEASVMFQSSPLAEAGAVLDEILGRAQEMDDVDVAQINAMTPPGSAPVSLPRSLTARFRATRRQWCGDVRIKPRAG
jgi:hypothetical protein